MMILEL